MQNLQNLLSNVASGVSGKNGNQKLGYYFDGVNDYGYPSHCRVGCVEKLNDGTRNYLKATAYGGYVSCTDMSQEYNLNSRSAQTIKFVGTIENFISTCTLFGYSGYSTASVINTGQVQVELGGTGSIRINSTTTLLANTVYSIIIRINNSLSSGTARVIGDADIFINGVKETKGTSTISTSTSTGSFLLWGAYNSTTNRLIGSMYSLTVRNRVLSDAECGIEGASLYSIVYGDYLRTFNADNTNRELGRNNRPAFTVGGNVKKMSNAVGEYFYCNGNSNGSAGYGKNADVGSSLTTNLNQNTSFGFNVLFEFDSLPAGGSGGIFCGNFQYGFHYTGGSLQGGMRSGATIAGASFAISAGTRYCLFLEYDANTQKFYLYNGTTLINAGGTAISGAFTLSNLFIGDNGILGGNSYSTPKKIYYGRVRGKLLSTPEKQAVIDAGASIIDNPLILHEIRPQGRKDYNLLQNIDDLTNASWTKGSNTTITQNYGADPDGNTLSTRVQFTGVGGDTNNRIDQTVSTGAIGLSGGELASKVMFIKCFVRSASAGQKFRLRMSHASVGDFYSTDFTATTEWKELTYAATFTSATNGSGIIGGIVCASDNSASDIEVRRPKSFFQAEWCADYSCSLGYIGRFSEGAIYFEGKLFADGLNTASSQCFIQIPGRYIHARDTTNLLYCRRETKRNSNGCSYALGAGFRGAFKCAFFFSMVGDEFRHELRINGTLVAFQNTRYFATNFYASSTIGQFAGVYLSGALRDMRVYRGTFTEDQKSKLSSDITPNTATKALHWLPLSIERGKKVTSDNSGNYRVATIVNGVTQKPR